MDLRLLVTVPNYISYFKNKDEQILIDVIGIEKYFTLYERYRKTGLYICGPSTVLDKLKNGSLDKLDDGSPINLDMLDLELRLGKELSSKIHYFFNGTWIGFRSTPIYRLIKAFVIQNPGTDTKFLARKFDIRISTIQRWQGKSSQKRKKTKTA